MCKIEIDVSCGSIEINKTTTEIERNSKESNRLKINKCSIEPDWNHHI